MYRLRIAGAAFLLAVTTGFAASATTPVVQGGGAILPYFDYNAEIAAFNTTSPKATISEYLPFVDSAVGMEAFFDDNYNCDKNASTGANGGACSGTPGGANAVDFAASDIPVTSTQIAAWAISEFGQYTAANLIQIPALGFGVAIPVVNKAMKRNGGRAFSDNDLCGIFSGAITNFSQISDVTGLTPGPITVVYRSDANGTSFVLTDHLNAVCTPDNTKSGVVFQPNATFAQAYTNGANSIALPSNFVGLNHAAGVADYMAGLSGNAVNSAVGYLSPDYTSLITTSSVLLSNGKMSPLVVAAVLENGKPVLPTAAFVAKGLETSLLGERLTPPSTDTDGANPANWTPLIQTTSAGYPIVGYTYLYFAQCYAKPKVASAILAFLKTHYLSTATQTTQMNNGFVPVPNAPSTAQWRTAITHNILANDSGWNINIENPVACAAIEGR
jgi:phosphate transport system substrate-binding protein